MPIVKVWCLPELPEERFRDIHRSVVDAVTQVKELKLQGEKSITTLFPKDMMVYGIGTEIIIEVSGLFIKPERTTEVRNHLAENLGKALQVHFPTALVECLIQPFDPTQGFWSSIPGS